MSKKAIMSIQTLEIDERYLGYCLKELEQSFESPGVLKALRLQTLIITEN